MIDVIPLFSINIFKLKIEDWSEKHRDRILDLVPDNASVSNNSESLHYTDYHNNKIPPYYDELMKVLEPYLEDFYKEYNLSGIATLWCQKYTAGNYHSPHDHGSIGFSAVLYAKLDEGVHPSTEFFPPFPDEKGAKKSTSFKVEEGDLIIFPAHLLHMAPPHYDDKMRVIFSFNMV